MKNTDFEDTFFTTYISDKIQNRPGRPIQNFFLTKIMHEKPGFNIT